MGVLSSIFLILSLCCFLPVIAGIDTAQGYGTGGCVMQGIKTLSTVLCLLPFGLWFGWDVLGSGWFLLVLLGIFILTIFVGSILLEMLGGVFDVIYGGTWLIIFILGLIMLGIGWALHPDDKEKESYIKIDGKEQLCICGCNGKGQGVELDYEQAVELCGKSAERGCHKGYA